MYSEKVGSYRTYEEWKHFMCPAGWTYEKGSYRTYEEWKLETLSQTVQEVQTFLPYL